MPVDPKIKTLSVTRNDETDVRSASFNFFLAGGMVHNDGLPLHPSQARDAYLRQTLYLPFHDFWSGAVSIATVKMISKDFEITSDAPRLREYAQNLHLLADAGEGWISFLSKIVQDFLCTDNGAFVEIVRADKSVGSRILGIVHLDSLRITRTGNAEVPAIYRDTLGAEHELQAHQVMMFADMPSPAETHHGVGLCAASRAWGQIVKLEAIERYIYDKVSGKRSLSLEIVKGIADKDVRTAIDSAKEMRQANSVMGKAYSYMGATVLAVLQDVPLEHISIPFASLPDGFNRKEELSIALLAFANAIGLDPQDLEPLTGQSIGTGAQSQVLHEKAAGKGLAAFTKQWTHQDNEMLMPDRVTFTFKEKDTSQEKQKADTEKVRTDTQAVRIDKGIITAPQAAQILADAGDLPKEFVQPDVTPTETVSDEDKVSAEPETVVSASPAPDVSAVVKEMEPRDHERELATFYAALAEFKSARNEPQVQAPQAPQVPQSLTIPVTVNVPPATVNISPQSVNIINDMPPATVNPTPIEIKNSVNVPAMKEIAIPAPIVTVNVPQQPAPTVTNQVTVTPSVTIEQQDNETEVVERDKFGRIQKIIKSITTRLETG